MCGGLHAFRRFVQDMVKALQNNAIEELRIIIVPLMLFY